MKQSLKQKGDKSTVLIQYVIKQRKGEVNQVKESVQTEKLSSDQFPSCRGFIKHTLVPL